MWRGAQVSEIRNVKTFLAGEGLDNFYVEYAETLCNIGECLHSGLWLLVNCNIDGWETI